MSMLTCTMPVGLGMDILLDSKPEPKRTSKRRTRPFGRRTSDTGHTGKPLCRATAMAAQSSAL